MDLQQIVDYIHACRKLLHDDVAIARSLIDAGWDTAMVSEGFRYVGPKPRRYVYLQYFRRLQWWRLSLVITACLVIGIVIFMSLRQSGTNNSKGIPTKNIASISHLSAEQGIAYTHDQNIQLDLSCPPKYRCISMTFSADGGKHFSGSEAFKSTKQWNLGDSDGQKTIDVKLFTVAGQALTEQLKVVVDTAPPDIHAVATVTDPANRVVTLGVDSKEAVDCRYDQTATAYSDMPKTNILLVSDKPLHYEQTINQVAAGTMTMHVSCQDFAGNETAQNVTVAVPDTPKPATSVPVIIPKPSAPPLTETTGICHTDSTQVPSMADVMLAFDATCEANYGRILALLNTNSPRPAPHMIIMLPKTQYGVAYTQNGVVYLDQSWFTAHPDDNGAIVHELTHVVQNYYNAPSWLTEGMADYARYELGFATSWSYYHCDSSSRYDSGYSCTATFLKYVQTHYKSTIVQDVHARLRAGTYTDQFFVTETGKTVDQLYQACLTADCKGGKP